MTEKQGKVWGWTARIHANPFTETHLLEIKKGGFCSEHQHARKTNLFVVISGRIRVKIWNDGPTPDATELEAGQSPLVPPGVFHQFEGLEESVVLEIYESAPIDVDIDRRTIGGMRS